MPDEALLHADAVVSGEAEGQWEQCLEDFEKGCLKLYTGPINAAYKGTEGTVWDLIDMNKIFQVGIQVSRGCPYNCDFCLVSKLFGRKMRYREIANVVDEIKSAPSSYLFFVDDNLTINKKYAKELMKAIKPLGYSMGLYVEHRCSE